MIPRRALLRAATAAPAIALMAPTAVALASPAATAAPAPSSDVGRRGLPRTGPRPISAGRAAPAAPAAGTIQLGPAALLGDWTVLRVAVADGGQDLLIRTEAFEDAGGAAVTDQEETPAGGRASLLAPSGIRLLSLTRGMALTPVIDHPEVSSQAAPGTIELFAFFEAVTGSEPVEVRIPGLGIIESIPVVSEDDAGYSLS
ncbi:non-ribosomal peptide synthetase [Actinomyces sp. Chiba101]|uniref:hypothetical protein n=1 Tax=Actinomyces TaxID=1654 RepID=UPI000974E61E|nr:MULTISPECIES: hypothetical protein [Actinomyces]BAW93979.1 non-ribosomal peptide synthetase [Actinomyces sp. Chiba101]GAV93315.1 non-ribosomal peptide synthetase [Actinomyces denticolens]SUU74479.1 Uncharacterised protein [Actinomyces denticolens]